MQLVSMANEMAKVRYWELTMQVIEVEAALNQVISLIDKMEEVPTAFGGYRVMKPDQLRALVRKVAAKLTSLKDTLKASEAELIARDWSV
ncbi:hypothetical protein FHR81_003185 [Actinoalloteichus hoggarensis]|uniref:Uncharacterized protein n=1 Tax=Actinoalloteichus hoggarensis TaxID=1470176 RepID=A0A221W6I7_9PSEU|nr:hypothetical protein [Actinoalloteichus hoggarensis]ASO21542.1 hypothetical protein AHOG_19600 [Actinoalloteichus hoggarensis]MBB5922133.1 hypothetical protein [Actinoalloteichus hoggarensis]